MDLVGYRGKCKTMLGQERDWFPWNDVEQMKDIEVTHCDIHHYIRHPRGSTNPSSCQTCNSYKKYNALETAIHIHLRFMESSPQHLQLSYINHSCGNADCKRENQNLNWYVIQKRPSINVNNTHCTNPLFFYSQRHVGETRAVSDFMWNVSQWDVHITALSNTHRVKTARKFPFCQEGWQRSSYENRDSHKRMWTIHPAEDNNLVSVTFFFTASKSTAGVDVSKVRRAFHFSLIKHLGYLRDLKSGMSWIKQYMFKHTVLWYAVTD